MFFTVQLVVLLCCSFIVWILGWFYPLADWQGNLRFVMLLLLLVVLTREVWRRRNPRTFRATDQQELSDEIVEVECTPRQRFFQRTLQIISHPITITLVMLLLLLARVWPWRDILFTDEAIWKYVAYAWLHFDLKPYIGTFENKTPGIFYLFTLSELLANGSIWFPRLLGIAATLFTSYGLLRIGRLLYNELSGRLAMLLFGLTMLSPAVGGQWTALTETFMICATVWGIFILLQVPGAKSFRRYLLSFVVAGLLFGAAIAIKQTAVFSLIGVLALYFFLAKNYRTGWKSTLRDGSCFVAGLIAGTVLSLLPLFISKVPFSSYLQGSWWILLQPGSSAPTLSYRLLSASAKLDQVELQLFIPLFLLLLLFWKKLTLHRVPLVGILVWLLAEMLAVNASGTYFDHQLRQIIPPLALIGGIVLAVLLQAKLSGQFLQPAHKLLGFLLIFFIWWPAYPQRIEPTLNEYYRYLPQTGLWLRAHTRPTDELYIFSRGDGSLILANSQRRANSRLFTQFFLTAPGMEDELRRDFAKNPPEYLLLPTDGIMSNLPRRKVPAWVTAIVQDKYRLVRTSTYHLYMFHEWEERGYHFYRRK